MARGISLIKRITFVVLALLCTSRLSSAQSLTAQLPTSNALEVVNKRGGIDVELTDKADVSITIVTMGIESKNPPVLIDRSEDLLSIRIDESFAGRVQLSLRIPVRTKLKMTTMTGELDLRGFPVSLAAQTESGNIRLVVQKRANATLSAETEKGAIELLSVPIQEGQNRQTANERSFRQTLGSGASQITLRSVSGNITVAQIEPTEQNVKANQNVAPTLSSKTAQTPTVKTSPVISGGEDMLLVDSQAVTLNVRVVDRGTGHGISGLTQEDFAIQENDVKQQITHFESSTRPFDLILLIDLSGSTRDVIDTIRKSAVRFVDATRPVDRIAIITFARSNTIVSDLTNDHDLLRSRINAIDTSPGDTKLYDALDFAVEFANKNGVESRRRSIVLLSDGLDGTLPSVRGDGSAIKYKDILDKTLEFEGVIISMWLNTEYESLSDEDTQEEDFDTGHDRMKELAETGGG
ncbi:MAG: VWA domain-containing protein, partial [Pyrinomonadaceae bacterium]